MTLTYTVNSAAIDTHDCVVVCNLAEYTVIGHLVYSEAITAADTDACLFTIGLNPDATIDSGIDTDLIYSVWFPTGRQPLDNASVVWAAGGITKTTDDYSVIIYGNTFVVHIGETDITGSIPPSYTATITLADSSVYTMTGRLIYPSIADTCVPRLKVAEIGESLICVKLLDAIDISMNAKMVDVTPFNADYVEQRPSLNSVSYGAQGFFDYYDDITEHKLLMDSIANGTTILVSAQHPYGEFWVNSEIIVTDFTIKTTAVGMVEFSVSANSTGEVTFVQPP